MERWRTLFFAALLIVSGAFGVMSGIYWFPSKAKHGLGVRGVLGRVAGAVSFMGGILLLISALEARTAASPGPGKAEAPKVRRSGKTGLPKHRPVDPDEEIAARYLGLEPDDGRTGTP
jgi:hypothetical protein